MFYRTQQQFIIRITVAFFFVLSGCNDNNNQMNSGTKKEREINTIQLKDLSGKIISLDIYSGKTIFINFWATWCKPCLQEMPSIEKARELLKGKNIEFLFASDETTEQITAFKTDHDYSFNYVTCENMDALNIAGLPTTFIFNPKGQLVFSEMGYRKWDDKENIDLLLEIINSK